MFCPHRSRVQIRTVLYTLFLGLLVARVSIAQPLPDARFSRLSIEDGLSSYQITALLEDEHGFLWLGTTDGLNRFDGYEITQFRSEGEQHRRISDNYIRTLFQDEDGKIWVVSQRSLDVYDPLTGRFTAIETGTQEANHENGTLFTSVATAFGSIWIGTDSGLLRFDIEADSAEVKRYKLTNTQTAQGNLITALAVDERDVLWVATPEALYRYSSEENLFNEFSLSQIDRAVRGQQGGIFALHADKNGILWIGRRGAVYSWHDQDKDWREYRLPIPQNGSASTVISLTSNQYGQIYVGTSEAGLFSLDAASEAWSHFMHDEAEPGSLAHNTVTALLTTRNVLWVGTWNGLSFVGQQQPFDVLMSGRVNAIHVDVDPRYVWIGTLGAGLFQLDLESGRTAQFLHDPSDSGSLGHNDIWGLEIDAGGNLWVATANGGLNKLERNTGSFSRHEHEAGRADGLQDNRLYSVVADREDQLWIGTLGAGANVLDKGKTSFSHYPYSPEDSTGLQHYSVWPIYEDHKGRIWLGTVGAGLARFDKEAQAFTHYRNNPDDSTSLSGNRILTINEDAQGSLWVGSMGAGLNRYDEVRDAFIRYTEEDGLPHNNIVCILPGDNNSLWISTLEGLSHHDPSRSSPFVNYYVSDGLPSNTFQTNACYRAPDGRLYFGTDKGLISFDPLEVKPRQSKRVQFTHLDLFNQPAVLDSAVAYKQKIRLLHTENFITFRFSAFDFLSPKKSMYAYRLDGLGEEWHVMKGQHRASYPGLRPGSYTFMLRSATGNGVWGEDEKHIHIQIDPPFWKTRGAYTIYGIAGLFLIAGVSVGYVKWQKNLLEKESLERDKMRLAQLADEKMRFFANISHEFRTPLTLIIGPLMNLIESQKQSSDHELQDAYQMMLRNSQRLQRLINQILDLTRLEVGETQIKVALQDLSDFVKRTVEVFVPLAEIYQLNLSTSFLESPCPIYFDAEYMEHIIANLLSNALKFTPEEGTVQVYMVDSTHHVDIIFQDSGPGIHVEHVDDIFKRFYQVDDSSTRKYEGTGIGLAIVKEMLDLHHGEIIVDSEVGVGSRFCVRLRKGKAHFDDTQIVDVQTAHGNGGNQVLAWDADAYLAPDGIVDSATAGNRLHEEAGKPTVLVVEDNADMRLYLRRVLSVTYHVLEAEHGVAGLKMTKKHLPDLIIADVMMEEMNGLTLCLKLKKDVMTANIPVLIYSARASEDAILEGLQTEADDYLVKPASPRLILARAHNLIALRRRLRELFLSGNYPLEKPALPKESRALQKIRSIILENMSDPTFNVEALAKASNMSYSAVYEHVKKELDIAPLELIRTIRLETAATLFRQGEGNVSEVAYGVGFESLSYFGKRFKAHFGMSPSKYMRMS